MDNTVPVITIDGPSGTGKGTLCKMLAKQLGWHMLDSGAIYRVLAHSVVKNKTDIENTTAIVHQAEALDLHFAFDQDGDTRVLLAQEDITEAIRSEQCGQLASKIAAIGPVRKALLFRQRAFAQMPGLVTDGRDMGTVVFPEALLKLYLDANVEERAKRRYLQLQDNGNDASLALVVGEMKQRDHRDQSRESAPLTRAEDAVYIDTTRLTIVQVFNYVLELLKARL